MYLSQHIRVNEKFLRRFQRLEENQLRIFFCKKVLKMKEDGCSRRQYFDKVGLRTCIALAG